MSYTVRITQRYTGRDGVELFDALSADAWDALLTRIASGNAGVTHYANAQGTGIDVTVTESRGQNGAYAVHDLACRYGALAVIL